MQEENKYKEGKKEQRKSGREERRNGSKYRVPQIIW